MNDVSDTILTKVIKKGDKDAFKEIYERYHVQLYYLAKQYLKDQKLAEDALQDIFLKLWKKRKRLDSSRSINAFLFTMKKNQVLDLIRKGG